MKKNKGIVLVVLLVILGFLGFMATNLVRNSGKSDTELLEFSIADTAKVDRIIVTEPNGMSYEIVRKEGRWTDTKGNCITQEPATTMLETFKNVEFKGYVPENARENIVKRMLALNTKVEIFQDGDWVKTWYVGSSTQDHYGTYMLLETPKEKSDLPVIMKVKGLNGIIEPRFFADQRRWKCTQIFQLEKEQIAEVDIRFTADPTRNFTVTRNGSSYGVKHMGKELKQVDTNMIVRYLNNYKKVHYELANFELNKKQLDSLKKSTPFCTLSLKETTGKKTFLKMFHLKGDGDETMNDFGETTEFDVNRFWCLLPSGEVVKCQYFVFNPLIMGNIYFAVNPEQQATKK